MKIYTQIYILSLEGESCLRSVTVLIFVRKGKIVSVEVNRIFMLATADYYSGKDLSGSKTNYSAQCLPSLSSA